MDTHGVGSDMEAGTSNGTIELLAEKIAGALQILYLSVKERRTREILDEMKNGVENEEHKRIQN